MAAWAFLLLGGLAYAAEEAPPTSAAPPPVTAALPAAQGTPATQAAPPGQQPIAFSHRLHAGELKLDCQYCHLYARRSSSAGVPPVYICAGCHQVLGTERPEVQKVLDYWRRQVPIPWAKVFDVPDFVRFPHARHVNARNEVFPEGVPCQTCHGAIEQMEVVVKENPDFGKMGWCLECHLRLPGVQEAKRALAEHPGAQRTRDWQHPGGYARPLLTDCLTCHN